MLPKPQHLQSDEDREAEDLSVSKFYLQSGNPMGAYLRAKDAVKYLPKDSNAHYALAQAAAALKKREEAVAEFNQYLAMEPDGDHVKAARQELLKLK